MRMPSLPKALMSAAVICAVLILAGYVAWARESRKVTAMMIESYDLLEAGKVDEAQKLYEEVLRQDPGNPLALNNLGAVMVKKEKYKEALAYLQQALTKAKDYKVMVNRVCAVNGICLAFRPLEEVYGNQELEPLIRLNLQMIQGQMSGVKPK